jgi:hypothetical protein
MIVLITGIYPVKYPDGSTRNEHLVSHGVDYGTGQHVTLPNEPIISFDAEWDDDLCEWVIN